MKDKQVTAVGEAKEKEIGLKTEEDSTLWAAKAVRRAVAGSAVAPTLPLTALKEAGKAT